ncbi:hypothetical protein Btru_013528 [Bulinus truncatus]|nr:hypothetical protein Btru_013528 [Bulinus truncatus]
MRSTNLVHSTILTVYSAVLVVPVRLFDFNQWKLCVYDQNLGKRVGNFCYIDLTRQGNEQCLDKEASDYCISKNGKIVTETETLRALRLQREIKNWKMLPQLLSENTDICKTLCKFDACPVGFYEPPACAKPCSCLQMEYCDVYNGACENDECLAGFYNPPQCLLRCNCVDDTACEAKSGYCPFGCEKGWKEYDCSQRQCPSGFAVPPDCMFACHCQNNTECDVFDGACEHGCASGWTGPLCSEYDKTFDTNFNSTCYCSDRSCPDPPGVCLCDAGWQGRYCNERKCPFGSFGPPACIGTCLCENDRFCSPSDGDCMGTPCQKGHEGTDCQGKKCQPGFFDPPKCSYPCHCDNDTTCDANSGHCMLGCKKGWIGVHCNERFCDKGYFLWPDCKMECHCQVDSSCNSMTGECEWGGCLRGWTGTYCNSTNAPKELYAHYYTLRTSASEILLALGMILGVLATGVLVSVCPGQLNKLGRFKIKDGAEDDEI